MTEKENKYAVVADGELVDSEPTKREANKVAKETDAIEVLVVPVEEVEQAKAETATGEDFQGIAHVR